MIAKGNLTLTLKDIMRGMTEADLLSYYLNVNEIPTIINSPLREDKRPSFGLYSLDGNRVYFKDLSTKDAGGIFDLLGQMWGCSYSKVLDRINKDRHNIIKGHNTNAYTPCKITTNRAYSHATDLQCKTREWKDYDIEYWASYGISLKWLKYAEVYPISHKIVTKNGQRYVFTADKYAYVYVERKDNKVSLKIYQPFNKKGYKWSSKFDGSVISLWTKVPKTGDKLVMCSSLKDALCLWANTNIPALCPQGEGYSMSNTAINELKKRFNIVYICFDSDAPGRADAKKLAKETSFINIELPEFVGGKDLSDYFKLYGKDAFLNLTDRLFSPSILHEDSSFDDLPFYC